METVFFYYWLYRKLDHASLDYYVYVQFMSLYLGQLRGIWNTVIICNPPTYPDFNNIYMNMYIV